MLVGTWGSELCGWHVGNSEAFGYMGRQVQSGMKLCGNYGYVGCLFKSSVKLCDWSVN